MQHSHFSPSAAMRYIMCQASYSLEQIYKRSNEYSNETNNFAKRGNVLHNFIYEAVNNKKLLDSYEYLDINGVEDVTDYIKYAYDSILDIKLQFENANINEYLEHTVRMDFIASEVYGTCDYYAFDDKKLVIVDYKFGRIKISAKDNIQLLLYMLGIFYKHALTTVTTVEFYIIQPLHYEVSHHKLSISQEVLEHYVDLFREIVKNLFKNSNNYNIGSACTYCKVKHMCPALATSIKEIRIDQITTTSDQELANIFDKRVLIKKYLEDIEEYIKKRLENGGFLTYTLQLKSSRSTWKDDAAEILYNKLGEKAFAKKIITITDAKKLLNEEDLSELVYKKPIYEIVKQKEVKFL